MQGIRIMMLASILKPQTKNTSFHRIRTVKDIYDYTWKRTNGLHMHVYVSWVVCVCSHNGGGGGGVAVR